jgi:hypothetical protein
VAAVTPDQLAWIDSHNAEFFEPGRLTHLPTVCYFTAAYCDLLYATGATQEEAVAAAMAWEARVAAAPWGNGGD